MFTYSAFNNFKLFQFTVGMITAGFNYLCDNVDYSNNDNAVRVSEVYNGGDPSYSCITACWYMKSY